MRWKALFVVGLLVGLFAGATVCKAEEGIKKEIRSSRSTANETKEESEPVAGGNPHGSDDAVMDNVDKHERMETKMPVDADTGNETVSEGDAAGGGDSTAKQRPTADSTIQGDQNAASQEEDNRRPDRLWILKFHKNRMKTKAAPQMKIAWENEQQEKSCERLLAEIKSDYVKARNYSISGDTCGTARFAGSFMAGVRDCQKRCPEGYLRSSGIGEEAVRNVGTLLELGTRRCLEAYPDLKSSGGQAAGRDSKASVSDKTHSPIKEKP